MNRFLSYFVVFLLGFIVCALTLRTFYGVPESSGIATYAPSALRRGNITESNGSNLVRSAAKVAERYVVNINTVGKPVIQSGESDFFGMPFRAPQEVVPEGQASGVIYTRDGYIITNNHVVEGVDKLTVTTHDGQSYPARLIGRDPKTDLAVIKIDSIKSFPFATISKDPVQVGDWVIAVGNALGLGPTVTAGIVSAKRDVPIDGKTLEGLIQTDAAINRGNSGGALADINGNLVGINTVILTTSPGSGSIGIGFAIPSSHAADVAEQLVKRGRVIRPYMGIMYSSYDEKRRAELLREGVKSAPQAEGVEIEKVVNGSPAALANLQRTDIITKINGKQISGNMKTEYGKVALSGEIGKMKIGDQIVLQVWHRSSGQVKTVKLRVAEAPAGMVSPTNQP